jgi:sugar lactone lactonase YvrE
MKPKYRKLAITLTMIIAITLSGAASVLRADTGFCGNNSITLPFTDVAGNAFFCQIAAAHFSGLTNGTTPTTYSPNDAVPRSQMAAFVTRTLDQSLQRGSRRAALDQWWIPQEPSATALTTVGASPVGVKSDGADLWVASHSGTVSRVRASDGKMWGTWTGATNARAVLIARGRVYITGLTSPGNLYAIDPDQPAGQVITLTSSLGVNPVALAYDGDNMWVACSGNNGGLYKFDPDSATVGEVGNFQQPYGLVFDGANIWVADRGDNRLYKVDANGNKAPNSAQLPGTPNYPVFDGTNIWVPCANGDVVVVRAKGALYGQVLQTISLGGAPAQAAFDGEHIMVTRVGVSQGVALIKASSFEVVEQLIPIGQGSQPAGVCSDGVNFWVTLYNTGKLARL